jgi:8-oxo-dGTP pyrophosphatase MutT (NUDIX family)
MKIFLNDRIIMFLAGMPESMLSSDLVHEYGSEQKLRQAWEEFYRYEKFRKFIVIDPFVTETNYPPAVNAFFSFLKVVQAAGGLVRNEKGDYLFIHRFGVWDLPKGKIDKKDIPGPGLTVLDDASARAAAIREVKEETGLLSVVAGKELMSTWHIYTQKEKIILKKTRWFDMLADSGQTLKPETREGIFLVKWTPHKNIHCILSHTYASLRELLLEVIF